MRYVHIACGVVVVISSHRALALHAGYDGHFNPHSGELQFSHMGKVFPNEQEDRETDTYTSQNEDTTEAWEDKKDREELTSPNNGSTKDYVEGGSERSMDNVPVSDMKKPEDQNGQLNGEPSVNNTTSNTSTTSNNSNTTGPTTSDNSSRVDQSNTYNHTVKHGASNYKGDTSTYVTNNFFNPPMPEGTLEGYPKGAILELQYLWKLINAISDKLDKIFPLATGDPRPDINKRKGLIITFDSQSDPDKPTLDLESRSTHYDVM